MPTMGSRKIAKSLEPVILCLLLAVNCACRTSQDKILPHFLPFLDTRAQQVNGIQLSLVANVAQQDIKGVQAMAAVNYAERHVYGAQLLGLVVNYAEGGVTGAQISCVLNATEDSVRGAQMAPLAGNVAGEVRGCQLGWGNKVRKLRGGQFGIVNQIVDAGGGCMVAEEKTRCHDGVPLWGAQMGVANLSRTRSARSEVVVVHAAMYSWQVGVLNYSRSVCSQLGIFNCARPETSGQWQFGVLNIMVGNMFPVLPFANRSQ